MLGKLIDDLDDPNVVLDLVVALDAPDLLSRIGRAAEAEGLTPSAYLAASVRTFVDEASDDTWLQLVGIMNRAEDPSLAAMRAILEAVLPVNEGAAT
ncbi:conserved hypothetical protein [uncultured Pleomorphomonas sp.]|uniref:Uncharacterized protein n=1 Tax=uncultured Pleomorphomonas sp. TaxID=442121 RepID=A0A212LFR6_9HYPH|nr:hypothetical protein [uncultured Pleomorphomonas sp.]SCM76416.1 conserved hypothetical protein [uncultured Pleomorphomonas sp.]